MADYIFIFHVQGGNAQRVEIEFDSDEEALATANYLAARFDIDVWVEDEVVALFERRSHTEKPWLLCH